MTLLINGSFEGGAWRKTHAGVEYGEIEAPQGWVSFWREDAGYKRPECKVLSPASPLWLQWQDPKRYYDGVQAWLCFTAFGKQWAGLYQTVYGLTPGKRYRLRAFAHAWSYHPGIDPEATSAHCSVGVGCSPVYIPCDQIPPLNGDPLNDAVGNFRFALGMTEGATADPFNADYGTCAAIYNGFHEVPALEFVAQSGTATVYLLAQSLWQFQNSDAYWDTVTLEEVDDMEPPACPGAPRIQYPRVTNVLPGDTDPERAAQIFKMLWRKGHQTVTGSYDDAGVGALDDKTAVLWNIPESQEQIYRDWYAEHYPGTVVRFESYADTGIIIPKVLCQRDPEWRDRHFGGRTCALTIGKAGCFITGIAEAQRWYGIRQDATPVTVDETVGADGYTVCLLKWSAISDKLGMSITSVGDLNAHLDAGRVALLRVLPESPEHFVLAVKRVGGDYLIRDPLYGTEELLSNRYRGIQSFRLLTPQATGNPPPVPHNPEPARILGLHLQDWNNARDAVREFTARVQPSVLKVVSFLGPVPELHALAPNAAIVYRHCLTREDELACLADPANRAAWFLGQFAEQVAPYIERGEITHVETAINETLDGDRVQAAVNFELAFIAELKRRLPKAKPLVATIAVGNPHESQYPLLLPLARVVAEVGGAFGYHAYWPVARGASALVTDWQWHAGRFEDMDALFRANGYAVDWLLSECGPCGGQWEGDHFAYDPDAGWRHPQCFNNDWDATLADIERFRRRLQHSPARVLGATWFTLCSWDWRHFNLGATELATL